MRKGEERRGKERRGAEKIGGEGGGKENKRRGEERRVVVNESEFRTQAKPHEGSDLQELVAGLLQL